MEQTSDKYQVITAADDPDLVGRAAERIGDHWPEFMLHDPVANYLADCYTKLPQYQFVMVESEHGRPVGIANSIPIQWNDELARLPDEGWDWALTKGMDDLENRHKPNILCALQIVVFSEYRGQGISSRMVECMKEIGRVNNLSGLIAPVRPSRKCDFPNVPIDDYILRTNDDGRLFDPWLRVHIDLGARIIKPCPKAMRITGSVAEWEKWTKMRFPQSGQYVVPGALVPVTVDIDSDVGTYIEPNVWMWHSFG